MPPVDRVGEPWSCDADDPSQGATSRPHDDGLYRHLFDRSLDGILLIGSKGTILDANPVACCLLGMSKEEICAAGRQGVTMPGLDLELAVELLVRTGRVSAEATCLRKGGGAFPAEFTSFVLPTADGSFRAFLIFRDISERRKAEDALRQSEARLVRGQEVAHVGNWEIDLAARTMWASREGFRIYGLDQSLFNLDLEYAQSFVVAEDRPRMDAALEDLIAGRAPYDMEFRVTRLSDGAVRTLHSMAEVVRDEGGVPVKVVGAVQDVTEQRLVEERLRLIQYSVDHARDSVLWSDSEARVIWFNDSTCANLGYTREELLTLTLFDIDPHLDRDKWDEVWRRMKNEDGLTFESTHRRSNGDIFPVEVVVNYVEYGGKEFNCGVARDISERKAAEDALSASEQRLRQSQKMEAIGQLAGGIAHDFNNLLTAILGYSEILLAGTYGEDPEYRPDLEEIRRAAERAGALTRQILAFSRRQALQPRVASLNEILTGMESLLRRSLGAEVELHFRLQPALGFVELDAHQFEQVLINLALNARDAMPVGGRLTFETANAEVDEAFILLHPELTPGSYVAVCVTDTGLGMDEATLGRIYEPFFTTKEAGKGTGLGLSTAYGIVRQSGGYITVESSIGQGSSFTVYLPRVYSAEHAQGEAPRPSSSPSQGGETVLVVEDEPAVRSLVARVLRGVGHKVIEAGSGAEALDILQKLERSPDLLLTDLVLPGGMQGHELAEMLQPSLPALRVVFMSGYSRDTIMRGGRIDEGVVFLQKPFTREALARTVREALDTGR